MELGKNAGKIILLLDDDRAGLSAAVRVCTKVEYSSVQCSTVMYSAVQ